MKDKPVVSTRVCSLMGRRDTSRSPRNAKRSSARRAFFKSSRDIPREKARYVFGRAAPAGVVAREAPAGVVVPEALTGAEAPEALAGLVVVGIAAREAFAGSEAAGAAVPAGVVAREALAGSEAAGAAVPAGSGDREKLWAERGRFRVASWKQKTKKETALMGVPG